VSQVYFHFPSPFSLFLLPPLSPQSFASAHHHHFRHRAPPSATSPTELHQRTATDNAHHPKTGRPNDTHGTRSLPPPPSTDAHHHPVPSLTTNSTGTHHPNTTLSLSPSAPSVSAHHRHLTHQRQPPTTAPAWTATSTHVGLFKWIPLPILSVSLSQNGYRLRKFSVPAESGPRFTGNLQVSL
jgi:hypothetical protein